MGHRVWLYHREHGAEIFDSGEIEKLIRDGWCDSPAKLVADEVTVEAKDEPPVTKSQADRELFRKIRIRR